MQAQTDTVKEKEQIRTLKFELDRSGREMESLRLRLETEQRRAASSSHREGVSQQKVAALEEEITLLRQQVRVFLHHNFESVLCIQVLCASKLDA